MTAWIVTYFNPGTGQRHTLIDKVDEATADHVVMRFSNTLEPYTWLPEVRKELDTMAADRAYAAAKDDGTLQREADARALAQQLRESQND